MSGQDSPITLALNYQHSVGWLRPYFDALAEGRALATRCDTCGKVWMPPRPACPDGHGATTWHELPATGRIVALTATNAAKIYGLHPRKGTIAVGSDADIAIWDPEWTRTISQDMLHDNMDYTPYEGRQVTGWPRLVLSRGRVVVEDETLRVERGSGAFLERAPDKPASTEPAAETPLDPAANFGAKLL